MRPATCTGCGRGFDPVTAHLAGGADPFCIACAHLGLEAGEKCPECPATNSADPLLEGVPDDVVRYADELLAFSDRLAADVERMKTTARTREEWVAVQQLDNARNAVYSAQCWVLRAALERRDRRVSGSAAAASR